MSAPWWRTAVVYQVYPRSFADADGDGIGDLRGVIDHLDHLEWLGVDVLWLSPVYPSPQADNGYDISDYRDIDPRFGTLATFDELLAGVHARGMKLMMDVVVNHTSDQHPWFEASRSSKDDPRRDWYIWRATPPNDWPSFFAGPAWEQDPATGDFYLHLFTKQQPDLNWENPEVRAAVHDMLRWWLERGVDGLRLDVINLLSKDLDRPAPEGFTDGPRIHEFLHELHEAVLTGREPVIMTVGETPGAPLEEARRYTDPMRRELDMVFQFEHMELDRGFTKYDPLPLHLPDLKRNLARWQVGIGDGWNSLYWDNHDQPRIVSRWGDDGEHRVASAKMLATILHLQRGTPFVFQGEELGMTNIPLARAEDIDDVEARGHFAAAVAAGVDPETMLDGIRAMGRDNARSPMQWDDTPNAGFTTGKPWLPVNPNFRTINARATREDPASVAHHYRRLIRLRHEEPVIAHGDFTLLAEADEALFAYLRRLDDVEVLVLGNFGEVPLIAAIPGAAAWAEAEVLVGEADGDPLALGAWEGRALRRIRH